MSGIPIRGQARGSAGAAFEIAKRRGAERLDFLRDYLTELYRVAAACGVNADVLVAQADLETGAFTSEYYRRDGNVAGFGAFDDGSNEGHQYGAQQAGRGHVAHMCAYLGHTDIPAAYIQSDPRWRAVFDAGYVGSVTTTDDLGNGRWATDPQYASKLRSRYIAYWGDPPVISSEEQSVALKPYRFVGLDRDVYLPDDIEVIIDIVPDRLIGWVRSGVGNAPNYSTWHDTGNSGANALHERSFLHGGPRDQYGNKVKVGYNFAVDDRRIVQLTPLDETTWAAGTPDGNSTSWHTEQCFGPGIDFARSTRNCAALHGSLIAAMPGWELEPSLVQHNVWYGKDCPGQLRHRGGWPQAVAQAKQFFTAAREAAGGKQPTPTPKPTPQPKPTPVTLVLTQRVPVRRDWNDPKTEIGHLEPGDEIEVLDIVFTGTKVDWVNARFTRNPPGPGTGYLPNHLLISTLRGKE